MDRKITRPTNPRLDTPRLCTPFQSSSDGWSDDCSPATPAYSPTTPCSETTDERPYEWADERPATPPTDIATPAVFLVRVRVQLLYPLPSIVRALWKYQYMPVVLKHHLAPDNDSAPKKHLVLVRHAYHRLNAHDGLVDYVYRVTSTDSCTLRDLAPRRITFNDVRFTIVRDARSHRSNVNQLVDRRVDHLSELLERKLWKRVVFTAQRTVKKSVQVFRRDAGWWYDTLFREPDQRWYRLSSADRREEVIGREDFKRTARSLSLYTTIVRDRYERIGDHDQAVNLLLRANERERAALNKLYLEPPTASLLVSYLNTIFMSNKQQHGLNTKHAASIRTNATNDAKTSYASQRSFDPKIYLDMCSICSTRDIFEIMVKLDKRSHPRLPCACPLCRDLCEMANAWKFYDCVDTSRLRLEYNRRFYAKVVQTLSQYPREHEDDARLVYQSYKNEFADRDAFVSNFVNYYSFYENDEQPVSRDDYSSDMQMTISIIFIFGVVNAELIRRTGLAGNPHNSISLNQQSIFKSMDNTLYALFSENPINRMLKETKQKLLSINAPYMNRGYGSLPNNGGNAITTTIL